MANTMHCAVGREKNYILKSMSPDLKRQNLSAPNKPTQVI